MEKYTKFLAVAMAIVMLVAPFSYAGLQDRSSLIELERNPNNRIKCPEISAPSGDPPSNFGWIYVKDDSGTSDVYYEADDGTVTSLTDSASGVTDMDGAYNGGSTVTIDASAVLWQTGHATNDMMEFNKTTGSGNTIDITNAGTGYDIDGTGSLWYATKAGLGFFTTMQAATITGTNYNAGTWVSTLGLDDGSGASPSIVFTDGTDETATFTKADSGKISVTTQAADGFQVLTGNLSIGNGTPGTAPMDGEDAYIEGALEVDGAVQLDGAVTMAGTLATGSTIAASGTTTFTFGATEQIVVDAATTDHTGTSGALDVNFDSLTTGAEGVNVKATFVAGGGGSEVVSGIVVDVDDDSDAAGVLVGIDVNSSDATGSSTVVGVRLGSALEDQISSTVGAANQAIVVDATTTANTGTAGVIDMNYRTATTTSNAMNLDVESDVAGGAGEVVSGIVINLDDDANTASDELRAISLTTDGDATGLQYGLYVSGAGYDAALYASNGYVRVGTGDTPDVTPGDDDVFVEGTVEINGSLYPDGNVIGDGATQVYGTVSLTEDVTGANAIAITECGTTYTNTGAVGSVVETLPEASTAIGCEFCFAVTAAQQHNVNPNDGTDQILGLTDAAGDSVQSNAAGDYICVMAVGDDAWAVTQTNNSTNNADGWADAN